MVHGHSHDRRRLYAAFYATLEALEEIISGEQAQETIAQASEEAQR